MSIVFIIHEKEIAQCRFLSLTKAKRLISPMFDPKLSGSYTMKIATFGTLVNCVLLYKFYCEKNRTKMLIWTFFWASCLFLLSVNVCRYRYVQSNNLFMHLGSSDGSYLADTDWSD